MGVVKKLEWVTIIGAIAIFIYLGTISGILTYQLNTLQVAAQGDSNDNYITIKVVAQQFFWTFIYPNGTQSTVLHIKVNQLYKLEMQSKDVVHGFFIPSLGYQFDVFPNYITFMYIRFTQPGTYPVYCAQYCGPGHYTMTTEIIVTD
jgi:cytochrome aa3-600 menaquinol oxidase subunit 2